MTFKNNPFNIRKTDSKWVGLIGSRRGFCEFDTLENGVRVAIYLIVKTYARRNIETIEDIISTFAPSIENDTESYINYVCTRCNCKRTDTWRQCGLFNLLSAMAMIESRFVLPFNLYKRAYERI